VGRGDGNRAVLFLIPIFLSADDEITVVVCIHCDGVLLTHSNARLIVPIEIDAVVSTVCSCESGLTHDDTMQGSKTKIATLSQLFTGHDGRDACLIRNSIRDTLRTLGLTSFYNLLIFHNN
jgi:hypothetical protein